MPGPPELSAGHQKPGAVMWTLLALVSATVLIPTIAIIVLFWLGALKRAEDLPRHIAEWAKSQDRNALGG
jgi:hypothetical protein